MYSGYGNRGAAPSGFYNNGRYGSYSGYNNNYNNYNMQRRQPMQARPGAFPGQMGHMGQGPRGPQRPQSGRPMPTPEEMGIKFEPVDSLFGGAPQQNQGTPPLPEAAPPALPAPDLPSLSEIDLSMMGEFVQNERNAALFYDHLSAISPGSKKKFFSEIAEFSRRNSQLFSKLYKAHSGREYEIRQTQVDTSVRLREGLRWAIKEESLSLGELASLIEKSGDSHIRELVSALCRKVGCLGALMGLEEGF